MADREELKEMASERKRDQGDAVLLWWARFVYDPKFAHVKREIESRSRFKASVQATAHAEHIASGYRIGFAHAMSLLEDLPFTVEGGFDPVSGDYITQAQDPELQDGKQDTAARRFSR